MDLSPNDIRNYEFPSQMRGYDKEEVDNLLEQVATALEEARQQNLKLTMEVDSLKTQLTGLKEFEDAIKSAAIDARRNADATIANAKKEAEEMLAKARDKAAQTIAANEVKIAHIKDQLEKIEQTKRSYISELRALLNSHMDMVDAIATADVMKDIHGEESSPQAPSAEEPEARGDDIEVTDSTDVTRQKVETLASKPSDEVVRTEEANAAEEVVESEQAQQQPEEVEEDKPMDPELAAALKGFHADDSSASDEAEVTRNAPPQGAIVETTQSAEDIPAGFIGKVADVELRRASAAPAPRVKMPQDDGPEGADGSDDDGFALDAQNTPTEHNAIDMDRPTPEDEAKKQVSPDELAEALDSVVSKFEEQLSRAEKS